MPDWSPVLTFGGYGAWGDQLHRSARMPARGASAASPFWGPLGCDCWAF
jgi:hypothetical protein